MGPEGECLLLQAPRSQHLTPENHLLEYLQNHDLTSFENTARRYLGQNPPLININYVFGDPLQKSFLDIACSDGLDDFVKLLLELGAKPNVVNRAHRRAPLHFAVENGHKGVLRVLLSDPWINPNLLADDETALHIAVLSNDLESVRILLDHRASPNIIDNRGETPLHLAATSNNEEMVRTILERSSCPPDLDSYPDFRGLTTRQVLETEMSKIPLPPAHERFVDENSLRYYLVVNDEENFLKELQGFQGHLRDRGELMRMAAERGFGRAIREILKIDQDPTGLDAAAEAAVRNNFHEALGKILDAGYQPDGRLLLLASQELGVPGRQREDRIECFRMIMNRVHDVRCVDEKGNTPLYYAARADCSEAVLDLLRAGSYIGYRNNYGVPPLDHISPEIMSEYLDECIRSSKERTEDYEIEFIFDCLEPHSDSSGRAPKSTEMDALDFIAGKHSLRQLLMHPVLSSFLYLKWHRIRHIFYANFLFYVLFYVLLNAYILCMAGTWRKSGRNEANENSRNSSDSEDQNTKWVTLGFWNVIVGVSLLLLAIREILQLVSSPRHYVCSFENWLEVILIVMGISLISRPTVQVGAVAILLSAWELIILIGQFPKMSTGIEMFKTVSMNFMRFLFLYAFLILAFAFSFYTLFKDEQDDNFPDPGHSLFKTIIMLTGEFDASEIPFTAIPILSHLIFILFVFLIAIVLFNLLNGMAVSDTGNILREAELVGLISRTKLVAYVERISVGLPIFERTCCLCPGLFGPRLSPLGYLAEKILFFPKYLPSRRIATKPYKCNEIRIPLRKVVDGETKTLGHCGRKSMDPVIVERAREILDKRGKVSEEKKIAAEFERLRNILETIQRNIENNNSRADKAN